MKGVKDQADFTRYTIPWLAGLLDREGSFVPGLPACPNVPRIVVETVDEDAIARAARAFGWSPSQQVPGVRTGLTWSGVRPAATTPGRLAQ